MARPIIYLDRRRDVKLMQRLQLLQRCRGGVVIIRHRELAKRLDMSESTVRRAIEAMVEAGHIVRAYVNRPRGGKLAAYKVDLDVEYRLASTFRRARAAIEQVIGRDKDDDDAGSGGSSPGGTEASPQIKDNENHNRVPGRDPSVQYVDKTAMDALLHTARLLGVDDRQRGWLRGAALKYGVHRTWQALQIAVQSGRYRVADLVRVTWGILKRQQHQQREVMVS